MHAWLLRGGLSQRPGCQPSMIHLMRRREQSERYLLILRLGRPELDGELDELAVLLDERA